MTVVYQIDHGRRRLLDRARDRTIQSLDSFFDMLGEVARSLRSDRGTRQPTMAREKTSMTKAT